MTPAISVTGLTRRYRGQLALDDITLDLEPGSITGLLGRNGAGKTTLMRIIAGHEFASAGTVAVLGANPVENETVLRQMVFVREDQTYPDVKVRQAVQAASWFYPNWSHELAGALLEEFDLPLNRKVRKLSRGMRSALGIVIGLAARAEVTLVRRAVRGPGPGGPAAVLRPAARRLRRTSPDRAAVHPPDRRGRRPVRAGGGDRPRPDRAQQRPPTTCAAPRPASAARPSPSPSSPPGARSGTAGGSPRRSRRSWPGPWTRPTVPGPRRCTCTWNR